MASRTYATDHDGQIASCRMIHGTTGYGAVEGDAFADYIGGGSLQEVRDFGILSCPTAMKVGLSQVDSVRNRPDKITFAGNRNVYWSEATDDNWRAQGGRSIRYYEEVVDATGAAHAFCGDGRWWWPLPPPPGRRSWSLPWRPGRRESSGGCPWPRPSGSAAT